MKKLNIFFLILFLLTICCVILGFVSAIITYYDTQSYYEIESNNGAQMVNKHSIYHDFEVSLISAGASVLVLSILFLFLSQFLKIKNKRLLAIGAIPIYIVSMALQIYAAVTYHSYEGREYYYYPKYLHINTTCLALMIVPAILSGLLAIATVVYIVVSTHYEKKHPAQPTPVRRQSQQTGVSTDATLANTNEVSPTLPRLSYEEGARQLLSFKSLYDCGILTEEEFIAQKQRIISSMDEKQ